MPCYDASTAAGRDALPVALREDPILLAIHDYWQSRRLGRAYPDRADISPHGLGPKLLPHVGLAELNLDDLPQSRMRLVGTAIVEQLGFDPTGKRASEYARGEHLALLISLATDMLRHCRPVFSEARFRLHEERFLMVRRLYLPMSHGGSEPRMLLFGQTFHPPADPDSFSRVTRVIL